MIGTYCSFPPIWLGVHKTAKEPAASTSIGSSMNFPACCWWQSRRWGGRWRRQGRGSRGWGWTSGWQPSPTAPSYLVPVQMTTDVESSKTGGRESNHCSLVVSFKSSNNPRDCYCPKAYLIELFFLTAVKGSFYIWTIYFYCLRALPNQPVPCQALTKKKKRSTKIKKWKWFHWSPNPKVCLPVNQVHLSTFPFTQLSATSACFTEQNVLVAKLCWLQTWICSNPDQICRGSSLAVHISCQTKDLTSSTSAQESLLLSPRFWISKYLQRLSSQIVSSLCVKNTANICNMFCGAQKNPQKLRIFLQYFLHCIKNTANICDIFGRAHKNRNNLR